MIESSSISATTQAIEGSTMENNIHITVTPAPVHAEVADSIPSNLYKPKNPFSANVVVNKKLNHPNSPNDVHHITFDLSQATDPAFTYLAGQSIGILPPGLDAVGKPHKLRLYSIASPAVGEEGMAQTVSLCVKRLVYNNPETNAVVGGVCSNYLCSLPEGATVEITGPVGKSFLLPSQPNANLIMVGTGTGIAPFRGFLKTRYNAENAKQTGQTHLFFGTQTHQDYLYEDELEAYQANQPDTFHLHTAFSREEKNAAGERMYVQHRIFEQRTVVLNLLQQPNTTFYICGLKGMETGIFTAMEQACQENGVDWATLLAQLKAEHRWHVEVY
jgi:ferredoxin--NADP+ reductase